VLNEIEDIDKKDNEGPLDEELRVRRLALKVWKIRKWKRLNRSPEFSGQKRVIKTKIFFT